MIYAESTIDPAITEPVKIPIPFMQFTNEENLITSSSSDISYNMLNDDKPNPEKVKPANRFMMKDTIILPCSPK